MIALDAEQLSQFEGKPEQLGELVIYQRLTELDEENQSLRQQRNWIAGGAAVGLLLAFVLCRKPKSQVVARR